MLTLDKVNVASALGLSVLFGGTLTPVLSAAPMTSAAKPAVAVAATNVSDRELSLYAIAPTLLFAQNSSDLLHRHLVPNPTHLVLPQSNAFAILGHSCGGIGEQQYVTGFDPISGYPMGDVYLSTTCSTGGIGGNHHTYTAWAAVTWDFAGNVVSSTATSAPAYDPAFHSTDAFGDAIYNAGGFAYLVVAYPGVPLGVNAVQSGDSFQVSWTPHGGNPAAIASTTVTATPINSPAPVLTTIVNGPASNTVLSPLQPQTTYEITVVSTTLSGSGPSSTPLDVTSSPATEPPAAPAGVTAHWVNQDPSGSTDTLVAVWQAAYPGNSPVDQYLVKITGSDGGGTFTQNVSGNTLTASFVIDWVPNWSVTVQAHNAAGWGPVSSVFTLGGL
jgi:hypothetical protein